MSAAPLLLILLGAVCAMVGTFGGIGGATLLVPVLLAFGITPWEAAPLGMAAVAAGALAAASRQLDAGVVHHRLGLTVELTASIGTVLGALAASLVPEQWLSRILGVAALGGAIAVLARKGLRNRPVAAFGSEQTGGEWPGTLGGQYVLDGQMVPYQARNVGLGLGVSVVAGLVSGLSGVGGGFIKTPTMSELMKVPVKVASATTTFTLGITAATAISIYAVQGRIELADAAAVVIGAIVGGTLGARWQSLLKADLVRRVTGVLLIVVAAVVIGRTL